MAERPENPAGGGERGLADLSPSVQRAARLLGVDATTAEVVGALEERGVRSLLIKGPAIARWLYDDTGSRSYVDIDLMVSPADRSRTVQVLGQMGFTSENAGLSAHELSALLAQRAVAQHAEAWVRSSPRISVDLHRTIPGVGAEPHELWDALSRGGERLHVAGQEVEIPGEPARAVVVVLEAAKAGIAEDRNLRDLGRALSLVREPVWRDAARLAERLEAMPAFSIGLRLLPEGERLAEQLRLSAEVDVEVALRALSAPPTALGFHRLAEQSGIGAKLAFVARELVPERVFMRHRFALARRGTTGLILAYLWRPLWLLRHVGPGFRAWQRARRAAG